MPTGDPRPSPPPTPGQPPAETLVGGAPWKRNEPAGLPAIRTGGHADRSAGAARGKPDEPTAWESIAATLAGLLAASPAWTTSLAVHTALLVVLALCIIHVPKREPLALVLGFGDSSGDPGAAATDEAVVEMPGEETEPTEEPPNEPAEAVVAAPPPDPAQEPAETFAEPSEQPPRAAATGIRVALSGREPGRREGFLGANGGSADTEAAVALALEWVVRQQRKDGLWSLQGPYVDGGSQENRLAATAMALLALQGAGNTHRAGTHRAAVARGWKKLLSLQRADGVFDAGAIPPLHESYSHAQATIALCELVGMSRDPELRGPAEKALGYAIGAQGPDGGWRYEPGREGDMSVTGWYVMALQSGLMAGLEVPGETIERVGEFLDLVAVDGGRRYGYRRENIAREARPVTTAVTAEGLLCRQYLGWPRDDPRLVAGLDAIVREKPIDFDGDKDFYAWYYVTQVAHHAQGPAWRRWNGRLRSELPARQVEKGKERGSWDPSLDRWGSAGGRLFATCFATWMLEVYYRHLPLYGELPADAVTE